MSNFWKFTQASICGRQDVEMVFTDPNGIEIKILMDHWDHVRMVEKLLKLPFAQAVS